MSKDNPKRYILTQEQKEAFEVWCKRKGAMLTNINLTDKEVELWIADNPMPLPLPVEIPSDEDEKIIYLPHDEIISALTTCKDFLHSIPRTGERDHIVNLIQAALNRYI